MTVGLSMVAQPFKFATTLRLSISFKLPVPVKVSSIEDTFTGTGNLNEIDNLKVVANLNGCATMDNPTVIGSAISVPYGTSPQLLSIDLDIPIVLGSTDCILIRIYGDLLATADTETPGAHNIEFVGATAYG